MIVIRNVRCYARWAHRIPVRVINHDNDCKHEHVVEKLKVESMAKMETLTNHDLNKYSNLVSKENAQNPVFQNNTREILESNNRNGSKLYESSERNLDSKKAQPKLSKSLNECEISVKMKASAAKLGVPAFEKLKDGDSKLSKVMLSIKSNKSQKDMALLEGKRLIQDSIEAGVIPQMIFFSRVDDIRQLSLPAHGVELYKMPYKTLSLWSDLSTCPGVMGIIKIPAIHDKNPSKGFLPVTIICDNIRDPGNLGSILRAAAGVGCQKVILTKGCVNLWDTKVLRTATGAHFRVPIQKDVSWKLMDEHLGKDCSVFLADNKPENMNVGSCSRFQIRGNKSEEKSEQYATYDDGMKNGNETQSMASNESVVIEERPYIGDVPIVPYYAVDYTSTKSLVLVVGGESQGLSSDAFKLMYERHGIRVIVPLSNNVESLNTGTALGIIVFEMKRQFCVKPVNVKYEQTCEYDDIPNGRYKLPHV